MDPQEKASLLLDLEEIKRLVERGFLSEEEGEFRRLQIVNKLTHTSVDFKLYSEYDQHVFQQEGAISKSVSLAIEADKEEQNQKVEGPAKQAQPEPVKEEPEDEDEDHDDSSDESSSSEEDDEKEEEIKKSLREQSNSVNNNNNTNNDSSNKNNNEIKVEKVQSKPRATISEKLVLNVVKAFHNLEQLRIGKGNFATSPLPKASQAVMKPDEEIEITLTEYSKEQINSRKVKSIDDISPLPSDNAHVRWINCEGFNANLLLTLQEKFNLNPLAMKALQKVPHRPKIARFAKTRRYTNHLFMIFQILSLEKESVHLDREQVSMFFFGRTILTVQEGKPGDCWARLRKSLQKSTSEIREKSADHLLFALIDVLVDSFFKPMKTYGTMLEDAELALNEKPRDTFIINEVVRKIKRELVFVQRMIKPMSEVVADIESDRDAKTSTDSKVAKALAAKYFSSDTKSQFQEVSSNIARISDLIDTYKDVCDSLDDLYGTAQEQRANEVGFSLTLVSTYFMPLTFLTGVYGMNFVKIPELEWSLGYLVWFWGWVLGIIIVVTIILRVFKVL